MADDTDLTWDDDPLDELAREDLPHDEDEDDFDEDLDDDGDGFLDCPGGVLPTWRVSGAACPSGFTTCADCNDCATANCVARW